MTHRRTDLDDGADDPQITGDGELLGIPAFMAPEAITGSDPVDQRIDIYSVGCLAYWLLTGTLVFEAGTMVGTLMARLDEPPEPPSQRAAIAIDPRLEQIVLDCLAKRPSERPASADEIAERLRQCTFAERWSTARQRRWWAEVDTPTDAATTARKRRGTQTLDVAMALADSQDCGCR